MIKNERQYRITRAQMRKFEGALAELGQNKDKSIHPLLRKAHHDALTSQYEELRMQVEEYDALVEGKRDVLERLSLTDLPRALIQARIAMGLSQKELAHRLGLKEQQIQRYEANEYATANLERLKEIVEALGIEMQEDLFLSSDRFSLEKIFSRMKKSGFEKNFIFNRLLPRDLVAYIEQENEKSQTGNVPLQVATAIGRVFGWSPTLIFGSRPLIMDPAIAGAGRFKTPVYAERTRLSAYTIFAHILGLHLLDTTQDLKPQKVPTNGLKVREEILSSYGSVTFENVLRYVWGLGIPVLPLRDPGAFHGACWRIEYRNVIVLKQRTDSLARWLFDLLHELAHAGEDPDSEEYAMVEIDPIERQDSDEEAAANDFADDVMLAGRAEELTEKCVEAAEEKVEWLKRVVPEVAEKEGVESDALANYMAYRLSLQKLNWWGAASNIQKTDPLPWVTARDILLEHVDLSYLNEFDRDLLMRAIDDGLY